MRKFWSKYRLVIIFFVLWRLLLSGIEQIAPFLWPLREGFLGPTHWANFDGVHYLSIARSGYYTYEQAFFPFYSTLIRWISQITGLSDVVTALVVSHVSFLGGLILFYDLARLINRRNALWSVVLVLLFPTSFFFASVYTESLFFLLIAAKRNVWWLAGLCGMLVSNTRLFGVFLYPVVLWQFLKERQTTRQWQDLLFISLIPVGLIAYMWYLASSIGDPLAFFHAQPAFGAGRSGGTLIILPQVLWRYMRILTSVWPSSFIYAVSVFELTIFLFGLWVVWLGLRMRVVGAVYLVYALLVLVIPTLTGTLSSIPRYFLSAFPLFIVLANMHNTKIKALIAMVFSIGLIVFGAAFLRGHFVS